MSEPIPTPAEIRAARGGQSQKELARRLRVSPATVRNWEAGRTKPGGSNLGALRAYIASVQPDTDLGAEQIARILRQAPTDALLREIAHRIEGQS